MHSYLKGTLVKIIDETPRVKRFFWKSDTPLSFDFEPGQFVIVYLPSIKSQLPYRSYSIAGIENGIVELCISYKAGGEGTEALWMLKEQDKLEITSPKGEFVLRENSGEDVCFIATGTGVAPFRPMIQQLLKILKDVNIHLIYGNRIESDILYHQEFLKLAENQPNFKYLPILSRSDASDSSIRKGYVHPYYQEIFEDSRAAQFYICGWSEMIKDARNNLKALGYSRKQYFIESYD